MKITSIPKDGIEGLKAHGKTDAISGFIVFLIAMPLCLAIAKASGFPPISGIYTAIIGGMVVSLFMGARVTIKGPAAGLIAISLSAVEELGHGDAMKGYQLTLAIVVLASVIQILFGWFKAGTLGDFFPAPAVHGMLAAIGLIIISKQFPVLLGTQASGKEPIELLAEIPALIREMNPEVALIGMISLTILFAVPLANSRYVKIIPPPMVVLLVSVPLALYFDFAHEHDYTLGTINYHIVPGNLLVQLPETLLDGITFPDFSEAFSITSIRYVVMFALVGSLESILSAKAIDILDPWKRKSDLNKDTLSVGAGNLVAGLVGGLPMISEIVRSSANINNGAKTRWSNFFHGLFLLLFVAMASDVIEMIPNAALAAMLIYTGFRLASPREFLKTWKIGWDQMTIFLTTIMVTLATDLLLGIFAGVAVQFILHFLAGARLKGLFRSDFEINALNDQYTVKVRDAAIFSNYLSFKKCLDQLKPGKKVIFNFAEAHIVDHTLLEHLHHFEEDYHNGGGHVTIQGLGKHRPNSRHPLATRKFSASDSHRMEFTLNRRQTELRDFAEDNEFAFYPTTMRTIGKYKDFPIERGTRIMYEENLLSKYDQFGKVEVSDITLTEGAGEAKSEQQITVIHISDLNVNLPDFALEPEILYTKMFESTFGIDIDFPGHPQFSNRYYLRGASEEAIRSFYSMELLTFLGTHPQVHIEAHRNKLLVYVRKGTLNIAELRDALTFVKEFTEIITKPKPVSV
jgi:MFS superfamily sulfate permease-like transporter